MKSPFAALMILVAEFVIPTFNANTSPQAPDNDIQTEKDEVEGAYVFPEKHAFDAFDASRKLLLSQKKHFDDVKKIFSHLRKEHNATLSRKGNDEFTNDINGTMHWLGTIIDLDLELVNALFFGDIKPADDDDINIPWRDASSSLVLHHWKSIRKLADEIKGQESLRKGFADIQKLTDIAIYEIKRYKEYAQKYLPVFTDPPKFMYNVTVINITKSPAT